MSNFLDEADDDPFTTVYLKNFNSDNVPVTWESVVGAEIGRGHNYVNIYLRDWAHDQDEPVRRFIELVGKEHILEINGWNADDWLDSLSIKERK